MTEELYAFDAEYRARAGVVCGVDEAENVCIFLTHLLLSFKNVCMFRVQLFFLHPFFLLGL